MTPVDSRRVGQALAATDYRALARQFATAEGLDPGVFERQIQQESGFRVDARSPAGALGIAQFMPGTARGLGINPLEPVQALKGAARMMARSVRAHHGDIRLALAAYNAGEGAVQKYGGVPPYRETQNYVRTILGGANPTQSGVAPVSSGGQPVGARVAASVAPVPTRTATTTTPALPAISAQALAQDEQRILSGQPSQVANAAGMPRLARLLAQDEQRILTGGRAGNLDQIQQESAKYRTAAAAVPAAGPVAASAPAGYQQVGKSIGMAGGLAAILPTPLGASSYGYADPEGQGGHHLAQDWFAPAGTVGRSPVNGKVVRFTADPTPGQKASGQVFGGTIGIRGQDGRLYVIRHAATTVPLQVGQTVQAGQPIGSVKDWNGRTHFHVEAYRPGSSDREYDPAVALNPYQLFGGK